MTKFREIQGDLLDQERGFAAIGHGVNTCGIMGGGIAAAIAHKWPGIVAPYEKACLDGTLALGNFQLYVPDNGPLIFNLATQWLPGADARLPALAMAVSKAAVFCLDNDIPHLALPRIGCGIGGLHWSNVRSVLHAISDDSGVGIIIVTP